MSSKAARKRQRRREKQRMKTAAPQQRTPNPTGIQRTAERPTDERMAHGKWAEPQGAMKATQPIVDLASDVVGDLYHRGQITSAQEQAARLFQQLRADYLQELPDISGYKSCLAGGVPGYDDGVGNPDVIARYRSIEGKLSLPERREMLWVCDANHQPRNLPALQAALDVVAGVDRGRKMG